MKAMVVIPAHNEEGGVAHVVRSVVRAGFDYVVVNDGSTDGTAKICKENSFNCIELPINRGLATAFRTGVEYALGHGFDCVVQIDGDGQHKAEYISGLVEGICQGYDIVIGSRFVDRKKPPSLRALGSNMISGMIMATSHASIADPTSGMRAFGPLALNELLASSRLGPEPDAIAYLIRKKGLSVLEVPVEMNGRISGKSYLTVRQSVFYMARMTASILVLQFFR